MEDLYKKICRYDDRRYRQELEGFFEIYQPFDDGNASRIVVDKLLEVIENGM